MSVLEDRARVGRFVRGLLERRFPDPRWTPSVTWDERGITTSLTRGKLVLPHAVYRPRWWEPVTRRHGLLLAREIHQMLSRLQATYEGADESGRIRLTLWQSPAGVLSLAPDTGTRAVVALLAPGCRTGAENGGTMLRVYRLGDGRGRSAQEAIKDGWLRILPPSP